MHVRFIVACVLVVTIVVSQAGTATADCSAPRISFAPEAVDPGSTLTITGEAFWDGCIDSAPTQEVARPIEDIELTLVQDGSSWVVARGSADENAEFSVEVVVPPDALAGEARLTASAGRWGQARSRQVLTVSTEPAPDGTSGGVASFGPNQETTTTSTATPPSANPEPTLDEPPTATPEGEVEESAALIIAVIIAGSATAVVLATWLIRRRRASPR